MNVQNGKDFYFGSLLMFRPGYGEVSFSDKSLKIGNTTLSYMRRTQTIGRHIQIKMTKRDIMIRFGKDIKIRVRRLLFGTRTGQKVARFYLYGIKGISRKATGVIGKDNTQFSCSMS